jgi:hypothetical protein
MIRLGYILLGVFSAALAAFEWYRICTVSKPTVTDWYVAIVLSLIKVKLRFCCENQNIFIPLQSL